MDDDLVTRLLPSLGRSRERGFNVFDVMHHGTHEKQLSNVFRWLLDADASHGLGERFARIFTDEVNRALAPQPPLPRSGWWVRQEVNVSPAADTADIADLVLEHREAVIVVENYFVSDGHGHDYDRYDAYSRRDGRQGAVVLLCRQEDRARQTQGWENAAVVTYRVLLDRLLGELRADADYPRRHPDAFAFLEQMHRRFVDARGTAADHDALEFVVAMCDTGESDRYRQSRQDVAAEQFAADLAEAAAKRYREGRELLQRLKGRLRSYCAEVLASQLDATFGPGAVHAVHARYAGIFQWTVNLDLDADRNPGGHSRMQLKFGPSARAANEPDSEWTHRVDDADYSRLLLTLPERRSLHPSAVALAEVLDGLAPDDRRLHDEIVRLLGAPG